MNTKLLAKIVLFVFMSVGFLSACKSKKSSVDKRIQFLEKKKKRNPGDCPKVDC